MRLFIAINFSDEIKEFLGKLVRALRQIPADLKWVSEENLHLTLQFLGEVAPERVDSISEGIQKAAAGSKPFMLSLTGVGVFPSVERPRVLWVGVNGDVASLTSLQKKVQREMGLLGFAPDKKKFSAHLTLARARTPRGFTAVMAKAREFAGKGAFGTARVGSIELMQSELLPGGPRYSVLSRAIMS
ncbi:MAG: RNA 2',3'-cyclic phosphodiesterase [Pelotomaculum sp.]